MKITKANDAEPFEIPGHVNILSLRLHNASDVESGKATVGLNWYLPEGGGAKGKRIPNEVIYYMLEGSLTFTSEGHECDLGPGDSAHLPANAERSIENRGIRPAAVLLFSVPGE